MHLDRGPGSVVADRVHDVAGLGKGFARRKPAPRCSERRRTDAAQAKAATREEMAASGGHYILLHQVGDGRGSCWCQDGFTFEMTTHPLMKASRSALSCCRQCPMQMQLLLSPHGHRKLLHLRFRGSEFNDSDQSNQNEDGQHSGLRDREGWLGRRRSKRIES